MDRRTFLKGALAAPVLLGFPWTRSASASEREDWLADALGRMKGDGRPGIVVCVPSDLDASTALGTTIAQLVQDGSISSTVVDGRSVSAQRILSEAVIVCLLPDSAARAFPDRKAGQDLLLIDDEKRVVASAALEGPALQSPMDLVAALAALLHGDDGSRLAERAKAERAALPEADGKALDAALVAVGAESFEERAKAVDALRRLAHRASSSLSWTERQSKDPEVAARIEEVFAAQFAEAIYAQGSRLPYGTAWEEGFQGDPCPACGMAEPPEASRKFLRFLSEEEK